MFRKKYGITENQYMEVYSEKSPLAEYFKIKSIPRYILLNKEHKVVNAKAPRPIPLQRSDFDEEISRLTSVRHWGQKLSNKIFREVIIRLCYRFTVFTLPLKHMGKKILLIL